MGASLLVRQHAWADRKTIQEWIRECSQNDAYENGNSYSGGWNMKYDGTHFDESKVFESVSAAEEHIGNVNDKHGGLTAVPAMLRKSLDQRQVMADLKYKTLWDELEALRREMRQQNPTILARTKQGKSAFKACTHCQSKISVQHLNSVACPVCSKNLLRTPTDDKKLESLKTRETSWGEKLKQRYEVLLKKAFAPGELQKKVWVVGGWCAS